MKFWKYEKNRNNTESANFDLNLSDDNDSKIDKTFQEDTDSEQSSNGESTANDGQKEKSNNNSQASQESETISQEKLTSEENELNAEVSSSASQNNRNGQIADEKNSIEQSQTEMSQTSESREESDQNKQYNEEDLEERIEPSTSTSQPNKTESNPDESEESETSGLENHSNEMDETKHSSTELSEDKSLEGATKTPTPESTKAGQDSEKMQSNDLKTQEPESDFSEDKLPSGKSNQNSLEDNSKKESQTSNNSEIESKDNATSEENELARETKKSNKDENVERKNQPLEEQPSKTENTIISENNKAASDNSVEEEKKKDNQLSNEETDSKNSSKNPAESHSNSGSPSLQNAESLEESHDESNHQERIEKLEQLKNIIKKYAKHKEKQDQSDDDQEKEDFSLETNDTPNEEDQEKEPPQQNEFLSQLQQELPSFENRSRDDGYSISTNESIELPESLIRTIINKFLNQRFCKKTTDLNSRNHSLEKSKGFYKWEVKDIIVHSKTNQLNKVLDDKYGYEYSEGKSENIPLSFYFDMSCSMSRYSNMLAIIAIELLKKNVKVLIGYNERVNIQLDKVKSTMSLDELAEIIKTSGYYYTSGREKVRNNSNVKCKVIEKRIDNFLVESHAEKCVVFSDFDPKTEVIRLSNFADVYWFCFEKDIKKRNLEKYQGFLYPVQTAQDIAIGLVKVSEKRFESLIYLDNPENLQRRKRL